MFPGSAYPKEMSQHCTPTTHTEGMYCQGDLLGVFYSWLWPLKGEGRQTSCQPAIASTPELKMRITKCLVWTLECSTICSRDVDVDSDRRLETFEMWIWRRMEKDGWLDKITNEEVLRRVNEDRQILNKFSDGLAMFWDMTDFCMKLLKAEY